VSPCCVRRHRCQRLGHPCKSGSASHLQLIWMPRPYDTAQYRRGWNSHTSHHGQRGPHNSAVTHKCTVGHIRPCRHKWARSPLADSGPVRGDEPFWVVSSQRGPNWVLSSKETSHSGLCLNDGAQIGSRLGGDSHFGSCFGNGAQFGSCRGGDKPFRVVSPVTGPKLGNVSVRQGPNWVSVSVAEHQTRCRGACPFLFASQRSK